MNQCGITCVLLILVVAASSTASVPEGSVEVNGLKVTFTCPYDIEGDFKWSKNHTEKSKELIIQEYSVGHDGLQHCSIGADSYYFYTRMKVCKNCVDLDAALISGIVIGDMLFTLGVIFIVYNCTRTKSSSVIPQRAARTIQPSAPPPPDPDYQRLNPATRRDIYAEAKRKP